MYCTYMNKAKPHIAPKPATTRGKLLELIDAFLAKNPRTTPEGFGWQAIGDSTLVLRLRNGGDVTTAKMDAVIRYMSNPIKKGK